MLIGKIMTTPYFFSEGLSFTCAQCGTCCTGAPGVVAMTLAEVSALAAFLDMDEDAVRTRYLLPHGKAFRVREHAGGDCIFYKEGCSIYAARPMQCRTYPFWFKNMRSHEAWLKTCGQCPGIGSGQHYSTEEILALIQQSMPVNVPPEGSV